MNAFAASLQQDVLKQRFAGINPLIVIGLTEAILDLGLTDEQMHASVRSYARQLSAQVHPDRKSLVSETRQREIIEAFRAIDEFADFEIYLRDFKLERATDRREILVMRAQVSQMRTEREQILIRATLQAEVQRRWDQELKRRLDESDAARVANEHLSNQETERIRAEWEQIDAFKRTIRNEMRDAMKRRIHRIRDREENLRRASRQMNNRLNLQKQVNRDRRTINRLSDMVGSAIGALSVLGIKPFNPDKEAMKKRAKSIAERILQRTKPVLPIERAPACDAQRTAIEPVRA